MRLEVRGDKIKVTEAIRDRIDEKLQKLDQYFPNPEELKAYVIVRAKNNLESIEVTIPTPKFTLRGEEIHEDLYAAIDLVVDKLVRQVRKNKTKLKKKFKDSLRYEIFEKEEVNVKESDLKIKKDKKVELRPMDVEEAILEMELTDHDFYLYLDSKTNAPTVVYKRRDGSFGKISGE